MLREIADGYRVPEGEEPSQAVITLSPTALEEAEKIATKLGGTFKYEAGKGQGGSVPVAYLLEMLDAEDEFDKKTQARIEAATKQILEEQTAEKSAPEPPAPKRAVTPKRPAGA